MGANFSSSNAVAIWLDKPTYFSGDVLQGYVCVNVTDAPSLANATSVNIEVQGFESTFWNEVTTTKETTDDGETETTTTNPRMARQEFFNVKMPLYTWAPGSALQPGQYQLPFSIALPLTLPGSFKFTDSQSVQGTYTLQNVSAEVEYEITAEVVVPGALNRNLRGSTVAVVRQRLQRQPSELVAEHRTAVATCCCAAQGSVTVRLRAQQDAYAVGQTAELLLEVDNGTDLAFPNVGVKLQRQLDLTASVSSYSDEDAVVKQKGEGLPKGESLLGDKAQRLSLPLPASLLPTTVGSLIRCTYKVEVEVSPGGFTNSARLAVPLTVYAAEPPHEPYGTSPPEYWQPAVIGTPVEVPLPGPPPQAPAPAAAMTKGAPAADHGAKDTATTEAKEGGTEEAKQAEVREEATEGENPTYEAPPPAPTAEDSAQL